MVLQITVKEIVSSYNWFVTFGCKKDLTVEIGFYADRTRSLVQKSDFTWRVQSVNHKNFNWDVYIYRSVDFTIF